MVVTQGSQSLALGLTLAAAPQLVEGSRLTRATTTGYSLVLLVRQVCHCRFKRFHYLHGTVAPGFSQV